MKKLILPILLIFSVFSGSNIDAQICYTCPGQNNNVSGSAASAFGNNNTVGGSYSTSIGSGNTIPANYSFVAGSYSTAQSMHSYIIGTSSHVMQVSNEGYIFGSGSSAEHTKVMLVGHRLKSGAASQIIIGAGKVGSYLTNNKMYSLAVGFNSNVPTFFVSETPSNLQSGRVGIGNNTDPQAKLHIKADASENATMFLEATGTNKTSSFMLGGGPAIIGTTSNSNSLSFVTGNTNTRMFIDGVNGRVGIATSTPETQLHINGDITVSGLANEKGDQIVASDKTGKLLLVPVNALGDNLGNHTATESLNMMEFSIRNSTKAAKQSRLDGSQFYVGLKFSEVNNMILETGGAATFKAVAAANNIAGFWAANWACGGYGLLLNADNSTGGIYYDNNNPKLSIGLNNSKVGIGLIPPKDGTFRLYVEGGILAEEVKVMLKSTWPDYVFTTDHKLPGIHEVSDFIKANGHLPGVPSAATVAAEGIELGQMNALLLTKIEELTLYMIELQRQLDEIKK
ncbi:MAG: hypothetical protein PHW35_13505 [Lentimicrobiaceae bacterium]|nr:hypothetical protein [Lentimicrobiaceae bacterium]MDD4598976.1 hypothetical protein [Lentimicrobiaceae bacterium]